MGMPEVSEDNNDRGITMDIKTKFDIFEKVGIVPLDGYPGRVFKIIQDGNDLWYSVEYWMDGKAACVSLAEFDLDKIKPPPGSGNSIRQKNP